MCVCVCVGALFCAHRRAGIVRGEWWQRRRLGVGEHRTGARTHSGDLVNDVAMISPQSRRVHSRAAYILIIRARPRRAIGRRTGTERARARFGT